LVTPLIVSLYFGVFDFSWYFYNQQLVEAGVRDAARYMARIELTNGNTNPCAQTDPGGTLYTTDAANIAVTAQTSGGTPRVSGWSAANVAITCVASHALSHGVYADGSASMTIIYATTSFADPSLGFFATLGLPTPSLSFTHQERFLGTGLMKTGAFIRRAAGDEAGNALVETTVMLPILFTFLLGGVDFLSAFLAVERGGQSGRDRRAHCRGLRPGCVGSANVLS
jgi:Flp pilus assembly protein TadG